MPFLSELDVRAVGEHDWKLIGALRYEGGRQCFEIPPGAETDFASVPVVFQWLIPRSGRYTKAAVLHDHLWRTPIDGVGRGDADGIFRRCLVELGVPFLRRWTMWAGVRIGSLWRSRLRDRRRDISQVLAVALFPGLFVVAGGIVVLTFLLGFLALEWVAVAVLAALRLHPWIRARTKPVRRPRLRLTG